MIVGAGLAGLLAAHTFPNMPIVERGPEPREAHKALLRFRSLDVANLTGIDFKAVRVHKGIWHDGAFVAPNIRLANMYSDKVLGELLTRSIWNLDSVTRYIAPENFYERLLDFAGSRVSWGVDGFKSIDKRGVPVISTAPLSVASHAVGIAPEMDFVRAPITVKRYRLERSEVYQTIYFPGGSTSMYRASITGDMLILEFSGSPRGPYFNECLQAFGLNTKIKPLDEVSQQYGKIAPVDDLKRKALIGVLSSEHDIYSLGRFATWRNILLDDVVNDLAVIKKLITMDNYSHRITKA